MELSKLGYTAKWIKFGILTEDLFNNQMEVFIAANDNLNSHFRYNTLMKWCSSKTAITNKEIDCFLFVAHEDEDQLMAGNAVTKLFTSALITDEQFEMLIPKVNEFGEWALKLTTRETLRRRIIAGDVSLECYKECLAYKNKFDDNRLLIMIIESTENLEILADFQNNGSGKRLKKIAEKKQNQVLRAAK